MTKFLLPLAALAALLPTAATAEPLAIETVTVSIADLDLASPAGQRALDTRLHRAVIDVCGEAADVDLAGRNAVRACRDAKLAEAKGQSEQRLALRSTAPIQLAAR